MPKLIIKRGELLVKKVSIPEHILAFTVGSEQGNDIIIADERISFFHLQFEKQGHEYYVRDLQSESGTYINGKQISNRTSLGNQDVIGIGCHALTFLNIEDSTGNFSKSYPAYQPAPPPLRANTFEKVSGVPNLVNLNTWIQEDNHSGTNSTNLFNPNDMPEPSLELLEDNLGPSALNANDSSEMVSPHTSFRENDTVPSPNGLLDLQTQTLLQDDRPEHAEPLAKELTRPAPKREAPARMTSENYYLLAIYGYYLGRKFKITVPETRIGRDRRLNDIVIKRTSKGKIDQSVSRRHATIRFTNRKFTLTDRRSKSRTYVNQVRLERDEAVTLRPGDEIEIVSDRKSHILRMVKEGDWDFSFPKKTGVWSVRYRARICNIYSALIIVFALLFFMRSLYTRNIIASKPESLHVTEEPFYHQDAALTNSLAQTYQAIADFNDDNFLDLIFTDGNGVLKCIDGKTRNPIWINDEFRAVPDIPITSADLNKDAIPDVVSVSDDLRLRAIDGKWGIEIWKSPILSGPLIGPPVIADFNGDGLNDLAIASQNNLIYIGYSGVMNSRWIQIEVDEPIRCALAAGNWTKDSLPKIAVGTESGKVLLIDGHLQKVARTINVNEELNKASGAFNHNNQIRFPPSFVDLNGDRHKDLLIFTVQGNVVALDGFTQERLWCDYSGRNSDFGDPAGYGMAVGDLDGDLSADVVVLSPTGTLRAFKGLGHGKDRKLIMWEKRTEGSDSFVGSPVLADFNKNGTVDVILPDSRGALFIFEGSTGDMLVRSSLMTSPVVGAPLIGDLDNDHTLNILLARADGFYKLVSNSRTHIQTAIWGQPFANCKNTHVNDLNAQNLSTYYANMGGSLFLISFILGLQFFYRYKRKKLSTRIL
ncbi:MAG: FHA domain-containing protein [bacterium]